MVALGPVRVPRRSIWLGTAEAGQVHRRTGLPEPREYLPLQGRQDVSTHSSFESLRSYLCCCLFRAASSGHYGRREAIVRSRYLSVSNFVLAPATHQPSFGKT